MSAKIEDRNVQKKEIPGEKIFDLHAVYLRLSLLRH